MFEYNELVQHSVGAQLFIGSVDEIFVTVLISSSVRLFEIDFFGAFRMIRVTKRYLQYYLLQKIVKLIILTDNTKSNRWPQHHCFSLSFKMNICYDDTYFVLLSKTEFYSVSTSFKILWSLLILISSLWIFISLDSEAIG